MLTGMEKIDSKVILASSKYLLLIFIQNENETTPVEFSKLIFNLQKPILVIDLVKLNLNYLSMNEIVF